MPHPKEASAVAWSPDGKTIATACQDGVIRLWDPTAAKSTPRADLTGNATTIRHLTISDDNQMLVAVSDGPHVSNWDPRSALPLHEWDISGGPCVSVAVTVDGRYLAAGRSDGKVGIYRIAQRRAETARSEHLMSNRSMSIDGVQVPRFLYGTAWKENETQRLTEQALKEGFRGIDTANQRKHYYEAAVGLAISSAIASGEVRRDELFLQTKFTFRAGQDRRLPYDPTAAIHIQVDQSFANSLEHLGVATIDSYVLHGPNQRQGLSPVDWEAWRAMELIHDSGRVRWLGVSNVSFEQLEELCRGARVRPKFVQNRCYAVRGWDRRVREYCAANGLVYQGFSLLTGNRDAMAHAELKNIAKRLGRSVSQLVFRFALDVGMIALTGTTDASHMREDLTVFDFELTPSDVSLIERVAES